MQEAIKKALKEALGETIAQARENTIFTDKGRIFLDACALDYGAAVNSKGEIIKENGEVMKEDDPDYQAIISKAKKQARAQSHIGSWLNGA